MREALGEKIWGSLQGTKVIASGVELASARPG